MSWRHILMLFALAVVLATASPIVAQNTDPPLRVDESNVNIESDGADHDAVGPAVTEWAYHAGQTDFYWISATELEANGVDIDLIWATTALLTGNGDYNGLPVRAELSFECSRARMEVAAESAGISTRHSPKPEIVDIGNSTSAG